MHSDKEGLGRIRYVMGALEYERPFPGTALEILRPSPPWLRLLSPRICRLRPSPARSTAGTARVYQCCCRRKFPENQMRRQVSRGRASDDGAWYWTHVGSAWNFGRSIFRRPSDRAPASTCRLHPEGRGSGCIPHVFYGDKPPDHRTKTMVTPTGTDNKGNGSAQNELMTSRFPASAVLVELAEYSKKISMNTRYGSTQQLYCGIFWKKLWTWSGTSGFFHSILDLATVQFANVVNFFFSSVLRSSPSSRFSLRRSWASCCGVSLR